MEASRPSGFAAADQDGRPERHLPPYGRTRPGFPVAMEVLEALASGARTNSAQREGRKAACPVAEPFPHSEVVPMDEVLVEGPAAQSARAIGAQADTLKESAPEIEPSGSTPHSRTA